MYKLVLVLAVAAWGSTDGLEWVNGTCPEWQNLPRYVPEAELYYKFLYQQRTLNNYLFSEEGSCATIYNGAEHGLLESVYEQKNNENKTEALFALADVEGDKDFPTTRIFKIKYFGMQQMETDMATMVVATDQENYAVLYSCRSMLDKSLELDTNPRKMETVLVFTTKRGDTSFDEKIKSELAAIGLDYDSFKVTNQSNC